MAGSLLRATDCEIDDPHLRVSIETVAAPAASRAMIRIKRRTSALDHRSWRAVQWPKALRSQFLSLSDIDHSEDGNASCQRDGRGCADCLAHPPIGKIWPH